MTDPSIDTAPSNRTTFWPFNWVRDEKFWRDITVNVAGTGTVALIVLVYASLAGYLAPSGSKAGFRTTLFLVGIALAIILAVMVLITITSARGMGRLHGRAAFWRYLIGVGLLFLVQWGLVGVPFIIALINDRPLVTP